MEINEAHHGYERLNNFSVQLDTSSPSAYLTLKMYPQGINEPTITIQLTAEEAAFLYNALDDVNIEGLL